MAGSVVVKAHGLAHPVEEQLLPPALAYRFMFPVVLRCHSLVLYMCACRGHK